MSMPPFDPNQAGSQPAAPQQAGPKQAGPQQAGPQQAGPQQAGPQPGAPAQAGVPAGVGAPHAGYASQASGGYPQPGQAGQTTPILAGAAPLPPGQPPAPEGAPKRNTLGLIALIAAVVGFIFACIPGAMIVGWVLLPIAFILGIVSLFQKGGRGMGIGAIVVAVVGTIVGAIVFLTAVAGAVDDAFGSSSSVVEPGESAAATDDAGGAEAGEDATPEGGAAAGEAAAGEEAAGSEDAAEDAEEAEAPAGDVGTRDNPAPIGSTVVGDEWDVVVNSFDANGTEAVLAANTFNDPPAEGNTYAVVNLSATYTGEDSSDSMWVDIAYVTASGQVIESYDSSVVGPEPRFGFNELFTGAADTGNVVFEIPADGGGTLRVTPGMFADPVFIATN